jgi:hypothetical protein
MQVTVCDATGRPYNLGAGEKVVFGIKRVSEEDDAPLVVKVADSIGEGVFSVKLCPEDTADLPCGDYLYDVGLDTGDDFFNVIKPAAFKITKNVTHRGCAE